MEELRKLYNSNEAFRTYVDRYAHNFGITVDKALSHKIIRLYAEEIKRGIKEV